MLKLPKLEVRGIHTINEQSGPESENQSTSLRTNKFQGRKPRLPDPLPDFSQRESFPGLEGNPFDIVLHGLERLETIPTVVFSALLVILALIPGILDIWRSIVALVFMLADWYLLLMLPRKQKSFGPARPPTLMLAFVRILFSFFPLPINIALQVFLIGLVYYSTWIEPHRLTITRQTLQTDLLPKGLKLKVIHLGDLHLERITAREAQLLEEIDRFKPDIILFSGDFLNLSFLDDQQAKTELLSLIDAWNAPLGVFAVCGSPAVDLREMIPGIFAGKDIRFLDGEVVNLKKNGSRFQVAGLACTHKPHRDLSTLESILTANSGPFTILLYHSPDLAPQAAKFGVDLQLSGHTHGGQICMPLLGALFTGSLFGRAFQSGRYQIDRLTLYITRGIGMEGAGAPRARFLCPPEIILWEINP